LAEHAGGECNFPLVRYEDLKRDPAEELEEVAAFLDCHFFRDVKATPDRLSRTVELSTPDKRVTRRESGATGTSRRSRLQCSGGALISRGPAVFLGQVCCNNEGVLERSSQVPSQPGALVFVPRGLRFTLDLA